MSYILDALRRADAERQLGRAPDLHAQPLPAAVIDARTGPTRRPLAWLAGGVAALAIGLLAAWLALSWWRAPPNAPAVTWADPVAAPPALAPPASPPTATPPTATPPTATPPTAPSPPAAQAVSPEPAPPDDEARSDAAAVAAAAAQATTPRSSLPPLPPPTPPVPAPAVSPAPDVAAPIPSVAAPSAAAAAPVPPAAPVAVPSWRERPDLQRELPPIVFGGSVYSEQAPARIVVLNGRVFREGETIMPDLVVDEIRPRGAVLRWRGQRFSLP